MKSSDYISDHDFQFLYEFAGFVDSRLDFWEAGLPDDPDIDDADRYVRAEYVTGLGFVACQTYLTAVVSRRDMTRGDALARGRIHSPSGRPVALLVNAAANLWKHSAEWPLFGTPAVDVARKTIQEIESLGVDARGAFPCHDVLLELVTPPRFTPLTTLLEEWRDALYAAAGHRSPRAPRRG
jgi:hypothetical protein